MIELGIGAKAYKANLELDSQELFNVDEPKQYDCLTLSKALENSKVEEKKATSFVFSEPDMPQELVEDTIGFIVSDDTSLFGYKSIKLTNFRKVKQPINEELINKLILKSVDVQQLTISEMVEQFAACSPELRSQFMNFAAEVIEKKTVRTENRICKYE